MGSVASNATVATFDVAGSAGLEPVTSSVTGRRSNQLSYDPKFLAAGPPWFAHGIKFLIASQWFAKIYLMTNAEIARLLRNVAAAYTIKNENEFRFQIIAYERAADTIENSTEEINDLFKQGKLITLPGIGPSIQSHLEQLLKTGHVRHFDWVMFGISQAMFPLLDVPTLGPKKAYRLVKEFNLTKPETVIDDLEKIAKQGEIAKLEGFGEKSQQDILRAIEEYRQGQGKITKMTLPYAFELAETIILYLKKSKAVIKAYPLGSLRRMASTVGDIDIAVATNYPKAVITHFATYPNKLRIIEQGPTTASILVSSGHQIDLMTQPKESFGSLLQHLTGSKNHNIKLREIALKKGLSLSEYGIKNRKGKLTRFPTEKAFYEALGLDFIPPELREDQGEIEASLIHKLPKLIEAKDIKGDLHIHSSFPIEPSHDLGKDSMEDMLKKAKSLKYSFFGFSEHNPSISKHTNNQIYSILTKRKAKIEQLKLSSKSIRIINLLEVDILSNGDLAIDDKALGYVDMIIASVHSSFDQSREDMTKRVLTALSHPKVKILGHPTGRLLNQRKGYELEWNKIFDFCKKNNKALEINAWPLRLDLPDTLVREAVKKGVTMVINTDSHSVGQMDMMRYGVAVARRGWATQNNIVNTWDWTKFAKWLTMHL